MWTRVRFSTLLFVALTAVIAIVLLKYAGTIAERLATSDDERGMPDMARLEEAAFGAVGLCFLVLGLRATAGALFLLVTMPQGVDSSVRYLAQSDPAKLVEAVVETVAGLVLFLGRHGIAAGFRGLRTGSPGARPED